MPEFFAELRIKTYAIFDAVVFLEKHRILLSFDKKASKFGELLEDVTDELEGDLSYTGDEFKNIMFVLFSDPFKTLPSIRAFSLGDTSEISTLITQTCPVIPKTNLFSF